VVDVEQVTTIPVNIPEEAFYSGYFRDQSGVDNLQSESHVVHGIPSILVEKTPRPWFQTMMLPPFEDASLLEELKQTIDSDGIQSHHPEVRQVVFDSFASFPEIQQHYLRS
jgi:hypothetical protein